MIPKISFIVPALNEEDKIAYCLISLQNQLYPNYEIIVVDNGSTDRTLDIVKLFRKVRVYHETTKSAGACKNLGAEKAEGEILVFIDADEVIKDRFIYELIRPIVKGVSKASAPMRVNEKGVVTLFDDNIFRAIRRDFFLEIGGFNIAKGYADDQIEGFKITPTIAKLYVIEHDSLKKRYWKGKWVGESFNYTGKDSWLGRILYKIGYLEGIHSLHAKQKEDKRRNFEMKTENKWGAKGWVKK